MALGRGPGETTEPLGAANIEGVGGSWESTKEQVRISWNRKTKQSRKPQGQKLPKSLTLSRGQGEKGAKCLRLVNRDLRGRDSRRGRRRRDNGRNQDLSGQWRGRQAKGDKK